MDRLKTTNVKYLKTPHENNFNLTTAAMFVERSSSRLQQQQQLIIIGSDNEVGL
jgi:hypothetical protein